MTISNPFTLLRVFLSSSALALLVASCGSSSDGAGGGGGEQQAGDSGTGTCGTRGGMRGKTSRSVMVDGVKRTYIVYLPDSLDAAKATPLVFVTHGAAMNAAEMVDITQYTTLADSEGIAVAFLDGQGTSASGQGSITPWQVSDDGKAVCGTGNFANNRTAGDLAFLDAVKADVVLDQCVDAAHVFATGFSMGGYFTHHVGCDRPDVRAIAPHSGGTIASLSGCATGHVPAIIFHGTGDPLIADGCDDPNGTKQSGFPPSATLWAQKNGCQTTYTTIPANGAGDGGTGQGQCYLYDGCPADGQVELCTFTGMGHCWAGGADTGGGAMFGCPAYASATQLEWQFFKKYAW